MSRPCSALISSGENALSWAMRSEEHTSELQSLRHLYAVFCLRSEEHTSELQSLRHLVCRLLLEKKKDYVKSAATFANLSPMPFLDTLTFESHTLDYDSVASLCR